MFAFTQKTPSLGVIVRSAWSTGLRNGLLVFNIRLGIAVLLRVFKLLRKPGGWRRVMDLKELLDEKSLRFRVDAMQMALFFGMYVYLRELG